MKKQIEALNNFRYKDLDGKTDYHFRKLPLKSKKLFITLFNKHFKKNEKLNIKV